MWVRFTQQNGKPILINSANVLSVVPKSNGTGSVFNTVVTIENQDRMPAVKTISVTEDIAAVYETLFHTGSR